MLLVDDNKCKDAEVRCKSRRDFRQLWDMLWHPGMLCLGHITRWGIVCLVFVVPELQCNDNVAVFLFPLIKDSEGVPPSKKMKVEASQQNVEEI